MGTTEVSAEKSVESITKLLVRARAGQIATDYREGKLQGLRFTLDVGATTQLFELPARNDKLLKRLQKEQRFTGRGSRSAFEQRQRDMAERVGWRQLFRWVEAQLALIETGMVSMHEVFMPYRVDPRSGQTMLQLFESELKLLPAAENKASA